MTPFLSKEELDTLKNNPATAALGEKLEKEQLIPKSRFDDVNERGKKAEEELTKYRQEEETRKAELAKAEEQKKLEEGKFKDVLAQREAELAKERERITLLEKDKLELETLKKQHEESQAKIKAAAIEKLKDPSLKEIAGKLSVEDAVAFVEKVAPRPGVHSSRGGTPDPNEKPQFKSFQEATTYYKQKGLVE